MKVKLILPSLTEAHSQFWRPIKYSLFPPLGLATLAAHFPQDWDLDLVDQHVEKLTLDDAPDLVVIQVYITNAYRAYKIADHYREKGCYVILGGLHVTSLPEEAKLHADSIFIGPGDQTFPLFINDFIAGGPQKIYESNSRTLIVIPPIRRDLIKRHLYFVPNSLVVSRGCPHHCSFCYKDAFFQGGKSFYTQKIDEALAEISKLPGKHLYFLDDHILANKRFSEGLFEGMRGMNRVWQGAATVDSILKGDLIEKAVESGLRSIFIGFESLSEGNLIASDKKQNLGKSYQQVIKRLQDLGVMVNGSFVFGLDEDKPDVFKKTVAWAVEQGITTATFHVATPYPGTKYYDVLSSQNRIVTKDWDQFDTRHAVFEPKHMSREQLEKGYWDSYAAFYQWKNILKGSLNQTRLDSTLKHFMYAAGWKKFESIWGLFIKLKRLNIMRPALETILSGKLKQKLVIPSAQELQFQNDGQRRAPHKNVG